MGVKELFDLSGKVALVTGGASGFGQVFCQTLAEAGADVVCVDIAPMKETAALLEPLGCKVLGITVDLSKPKDVERMVSDTIAHFKKLDIAVNNAGIVTKPYRFHEMPLEEWERLMAVDLTGVFLCMRGELEVMMKQKSGVIINISSVQGLVGVDPELMPRANYIAAKHGVIGLTKQAALEYAQDNIRVNAIAPGPFRGTKLSQERRSSVPTKASQKRDERLVDIIPMKRFGTLDELKGLLLYLASDASSYITGQAFVADGGYTAH
jgi:NAD(P)-dependent dehydrogenase (short-subunit alcohol dehydrogenase family)